MLQLKGLSCGYSKTPILKHIEAEISPGSLLFVVGPNGSGKSTLLGTISGVLPSLAGQVVLENKIVTSKSKAKERPGYLPSQLSSLESLFVHEVLDLIASASWVDEFELLKSFQLNHLMKCRLSQLSTGEKQRVFLGASLLHPSTVLVLDEPLNFLELKYQWVLAQWISEQRKKQRTFIISLHQLEWCLRFQNSSAWLLNEGQIAIAGRTESVLSSKPFQQIFGLQVKVEKNPLDQSSVLFFTPAGEA